MSPLDYGDALGPKCGKHVFFGREVVEEGSLADVGRFGDVGDGGFQKPPVCKQLKGRLEKSVVNFSAAAFAAPRPRRGRTKSSSGRKRIAFSLTFDQI